MRDRSSLFIPNEFLTSILTVRLDLITAFQLENIFNRYLYGISTHNICQKIVADCSLCVSLHNFPKELQKFEPKLFPEHPGSHTDVMHRAGQKILVNMDLFSEYTTACILTNEQKEEMTRGLILLTTFIRHSPEVTVRIDAAPALKALQISGHKDLTENCMKLELGNQKIAPK